MSARRLASWNGHRRIDWILMGIGGESCLMLVLIAASLSAQIKSPATRDAATTDTDFFTTAETCAQCHNSAPQATALRDAKGRSVSPSELWPSSMMAHSSVDPFWRAVMAAEVAAMPSRQAEIEAECLRCHAPMASVQAEIDDVRPSRRLFLHANSKLSGLATDGVSCTVCHQISAETVGSDDSFSGHFQIGRDGSIFGPHRQPFAMPMYRHTGFVPTESQHIRESALCASCHTLITHALTDGGSPTGHSLLEQGPYIEWQNSQFNDEDPNSTRQAASCQDCHVPTTDADGAPIKTRIARNPQGRDFPPVRPREPFGKHTFTGGNSLVLSIIRAALAQNGASSEEAIASIDAAIGRTRNMLRHKTARVEFKRVRHVDGKLTIDLLVESLVGHKLPTAYPSRRVWIRLRVFDADDKLVFASGDFDEHGRIVDASGNVLPSELAGGPGIPHDSTIDRPGEVQIFEAVMEDSRGEVTFSLVQGARYRKDNRLLPKGWKSDHPRTAITKPVGTADDTDFIAGSDTVTYIVDAPLSRGPYRIEAELLYQVAGSRYVSELWTHNVAEMKEFQRLYISADPRPEWLDRATCTTQRSPK